MKIEYEIKDEEFPTLLAALNNGFLSLQSTYFALKLGCDVPKVFEKMQETYSYAELDRMSEQRLKAFLEFYNYLAALEKKSNV